MVHFSDLMELMSHRLYQVRYHCLDVYMCQEAEEELANINSSSFKKVGFSVRPGACTSRVDLLLYHTITWRRSGWGHLILWNVALRMLQRVPAAMMICHVFL